jgi:Ca2+-binding RTX toxin-like protein
VGSHERGIRHDMTRARALKWKSPAVACASIALVVAVSPPTSAGSSCRGLTATISGTNNSETISGTAADDVIAAHGGNDVIDGRGGNDVICAGAGNDTVSGGDGHDRIYGGAGADTLAGQSGEDILVGGTGNDHLSGGDGGDTLTGGLGDDELTGGRGVDFARFNGAGRGVVVDLTASSATGDGHDTLSGIEGIFGSRHGDRLVGDSGDNFFVAGGGNDQISGKGGDDSINGGDGLDTIDYSSAKKRVTVNLGTDKALGQGADSLVSIEVVVGSPFGDTITGGSGDDRIYGGRGKDTLDGSGGRDIVRGGKGDDVVRGGPQGDRLYGDGGNDTLTGAAGKDHLNGGAGPTAAVRARAPAPRHRVSAERAVLIARGNALSHRPHAQPSRVPHVRQVRRSVSPDPLRRAR